MIRSDEGTPKTLRLRASTQGNSLPYRVELWHADRHEVERLLACAASAALARAIFMAAAEEHPDRYLTLRRGKRVIAEMG